MKACVGKALVLAATLLASAEALSASAAATDLPAHPAGSVINPRIGIGLERLRERNAGADRKMLIADVRALARLARSYLMFHGDTAVTDFETSDWQRKANGLHLWGITRSGQSWFDTGHPELLGADASVLTDIEGRNWADLALRSAEAGGAQVFSLVFPHPRLRHSALGYHTCFPLNDGERILCAGGFEDRYD